MGAPRFVNILEWAERVARIWRKVGGIGVSELAEQDQGEFGALVPPPNLFSPKSAPPSSISSRGDSTTSSVPSMFSAKLSFSRKRSTRALPAPDPFQRPFDALVNYLPSSISDKALLKQAILVTTISRPFLVAASASSYARPPGSRRNFLSRFNLNRVYTMPPTPSLGSADSLVSGSPCSQGPPVKPRLVHLLPPRPRDFEANRVLESIESFLLEFSFPPTLQTMKADPLEPARTCLLDSTSFTEPVGVPPSMCVNWTVADVVLSGCLDDEPTPRVWLSGASDIVVAALPPSPPSPTTPHAAGPEESYKTLSPDLSTPVLYVNAPPTPSDSDEDTKDRHTLATKDTPEKRLRRWTFWKRSDSAPQPS